VACLTDRWPPEITRRCVAEYLRARWPAKPPANFGHRLDAARFYMLLRVLGVAPNWPTKYEYVRRLKQLHGFAEERGLI
jgi:hypothetical protein